MRVLITVIAREELAEARNYLEIQQAGLGKRLGREIREAVTLIRRFPEAFPRERGDVRKCLLRRFPYKLLYALRGGEAIILAVAHQHRRPDYWIDRVDP